MSKTQQRKGPVAIFDSGDVIEFLNGTDVNVKPDMIEIKDRSKKLIAVVPKTCVIIVAGTWTHERFGA